MKRATKAIREPTASGGGVTQLTDAMFTYHAGALDGSPANLATSVCGRSISISVRTSTFTIPSLPSSANGLGADVDEAPKEVMPTLSVLLSRRCRRQRQVSESDDRVVAITTEGHLDGRLTWRQCVVANPAPREDHAIRRLHCDVAAARDGPVVHRHLIDPTWAWIQPGRCSLPADV